MNKNKLLKGIWIVVVLLGMYLLYISQQYCELDTNIHHCVD